MQYPQPDSASEKLSRVILMALKAWAVVVVFVLVCIIGFLLLVGYGCSRAVQSSDAAKSSWKRLPAPVRMPATPPTPLPRLDLAAPPPLPLPRIQIAPVPVPDGTFEQRLKRQIVRERVKQTQGFPGKVEGQGFPGHDK